MKVVPRTEVKLKVVSTIDDRSDMSDEMANLCAKLPIYEVTEGEVNPNDLNGGTSVGQIPAKRKYHSQSELYNNYTETDITMTRGRTKRTSGV